MNWEVISTRLKAPALTSIVLIGAVASANQYFSLPAEKSRLQVPATKLSFSGKRVSLKGKRTRTTTVTEIDSKKYFFQKQTFLTAKRDQAIKLLRQELNSGYRKNRDNVLLRLGQLYTEKYMELNYHEIEVYNKKLKDYQEGGSKGKRPKLNNGRSRRYLSRALKLLTRMEREYPKHRRLDEVLFFIGFVNMEYGRTKKGTRYLERLVKKYPRSKKYNEATLYLADRYFDDQRFKLARSKYAILLRRKNSELYHYALYKVAWCDLNLGHPKRGLKAMKQVIAALEGSKEKLKFGLRNQALTDIATFFADNGQVDEAFAYYSDVLGKDEAYEKLKIIAASLNAQARSQKALKAYGKLLEKFGDSIEAPEYALATYESQARLGDNKKAVATMSASLQKYGESSKWAERHRSENPQAVKEKLERLQKDGTNAAFFFHRTAQKTKKKHFYAYGLELYRAVEKAFPNHPKKRNLVFYQAEILYQQGKYLDASDVYMKLAKNPPKDKLAEESAYNALLSVDQLTASTKIKRFTEEEKKTRNFKTLSIPKAEKRFVEVSEFYLNNYSKFKRATDVKFRIAGIYYRYHHFDKAAPRFKEIALKAPRHKSAVTAAHLYLDIMNIKKDYGALSEGASLFASTRGLGNASFKREMRSFKDQIAFKAIEQHEKGKNWEKAGDEYLAYYKASPRGKLAEQSLYNAVVTYEKAGASPKLAGASKLFVKKYPKHKYTKRLVLLEAKRAEQGYDFETAGIYYERFYRNHKKDPQARKALYNAAVFAELLGKNQKALSLYGEYLKLGGVSWKERRAISLSQAKIYRKYRNWRKVSQIYGKLANSAADLPEKIGLLGKLVDLYGAYGRRTDRASTLNRIRAITKNQTNFKAFGSDVQYIAEARLANLKSQRTRYERLRLRFPPTRLASDLKRKQKSLGALSESYEKVIQVGDPHWGVAALSLKAKAYDQLVKGFRGVAIPKRYKGESRKQVETQLKQLDSELIVPFANKAKETHELCVSKGTEFHVASKYLDECHTKLASNKSVTPTGILPQPSYWTTRWGNLGVASR